MSNWTPGDDVILYALVDILADATEPKSTTALSVAVTAKLRRERYSLPDNGVTGSDVTRILERPLAGLNDVVCLGLRNTVGRRKEKHWALHRKQVAWREHAQEAAAQRAQRDARVVVTDVGGGYSVTLDGTQAALISNLPTKEFAMVQANELAALLRRELS